MNLWWWWWSWSTIYVCVCLCVFANTQKCPFHVEYGPTHTHIPWSEITLAKIQFIFSKFEFSKLGQLKCESFISRHRSIQRAFICFYCPRGQFQPIIIFGFMLFFCSVGLRTHTHIVRIIWAVCISLAGLFCRMK